MSHRRVFFNFKSCFKANLFLLKCQGHLEKIMNVARTTISQDVQT